MKKTYITPNSKVIRIRTKYHLLAGSSVNINTTGDDVDASEASSRGSDDFNVWNEED